MSSKPTRGADRIIVALDTQDLGQAKEWVATLSGAVGAFKLGLEFLSAHGPQGVREIQAAGADKVFADTKFCDIPNTVAGAVRSICGIEPWLLNVHAMSGYAAMNVARKAAEEYSDLTGKPRPLIIAVTVLTSLDQTALAEIGVAGSVEEEVVRLAKLSQASGMDGVVASPLEIRAIREACGPDFLIVTPGVRPSGGATHDQARVATPEAAIAAGADYLVIGRAITGAADPRAAAEAIAASLS
jgi:orotidine-5'-phosphate decarboxylase